MFIILHDLKGNKKRFNVNFITHYELDNGNPEKTWVFIEGNQYCVRETPEELDLILRESYITVKEIK